MSSASPRVREAGLRGTASGCGAAVAVLGCRHRRQQGPGRPHYPVCAGPPAAAAAVAVCSGRPLPVVNVSAAAVVTYVFRRSCGRCGSQLRVRLPRWVNLAVMACPGSMNTASVSPPVSTSLPAAIPWPRSASEFAASASASTG
jgi:hypothetical protein